MNAEFLKSASSARDFPPDAGAEVAVVGRSNSGKSSAINAIFGSNKLARVSKTPGRTQLINFFDLGDSRRCVDLPGYGYARVTADVRDRWERLVAAYFESRRSLRGLMMTVDIRRGIGALDEQMLQWCEQLAVPVYILATKADKLSRNRARQAAHAMHAAVAGRVVDICVFSALERTGVDRARTQLAVWLDVPGS